MSLYVASHYKNTPNDLQLLSDAPAHHVFVLVPPVTSDQTLLPDVLCVLQVSWETNGWMNEYRMDNFFRFVWKVRFQNHPF